MTVDRVPFSTWAPEPASGAKVYLQPGQWIATAAPSTITTILGSCVAVCLWDRNLRIGGMNHYMLPFDTGRATGSARFGDVAISQLVEKLMALGSRPAALEAALVGGACVMEAFRRDGDHIGARNAELAERILPMHGIRVTRRELGGNCGRKLIFETENGGIRVIPVGAA
ncbi:MAG TPA: chemotaxis protein CheD [Thermoanaerobaculia bacterium]|nr:chemotaxis protein CheD [Thermoanaerobaculia bacterium]